MSLGEVFQQSNESLAAEITDQVRAQLPAEKARARAEMARTAKEVRELGIESNRANGRGQAMCSIPPIIYLRWHQLYPGCWQDREFVDEFLYDNPQCRLPGYIPKPRGFRHSISFGAAKYHEHKNASQ